MQSRSSYCSLCFVDTESDCYCDWLVGYDAKIDLPIVSISEKEQIIPEEIIRDLASIEDPNRVAIETEAYCEEFNVSLELVDALIRRRINYGRRKKRQEERLSLQ